MRSFWSYLCWNAITWCSPLCTTVAGRIEAYVRKDHEKYPTGTFSAVFQKLGRATREQEDGRTRSPCWTASALKFLVTVGLRKEEAQYMKSFTTECLQRMNSYVHFPFDMVEGCTTHVYQIYFLKRNGVQPHITMIATGSGVIVLLRPKTM
ncbi:hypothetical protein KIL84_001205 [Mauremys mutica]|uniref:Uncharacterized protein n=1 Tax=Mauremys mutica TaxID=74926 RepID=A0A9D4AVM8_9SAUR|nr:hypothetical protein KIL84_001205 [Mauremys mutica]